MFVLLPFSTDSIPLTVIADEKVTAPVPDRVRLLKVSPGVTDTVPPFKVTEPVLAPNVPPVLVRLPPKVNKLAPGLKAPVLVRLPVTARVPVPEPALNVLPVLLVRVPPTELFPVLRLKVPLLLMFPVTDRVPELQLTILPAELVSVPVTDTFPVLTLRILPVVLLVRVPATVSVPALVVTIPLLVRFPLTVSVLVPVPSKERVAPGPTDMLLQVFSTPSA